MDIRQIAQEKLKKAGITLQIDAYDEKILVRNPGAVFVCNQMAFGMDEWILVNLLARYFADVQLLHPYYSPLPRELKPLAILPKGIDLSDGFAGLRFSRRLTRACEKGTSVGLVLDFSENPIYHMGKNLQRNGVLRQLQRAGQPIVPIHLITDAATHLNPLLRSIQVMPFMGASQSLTIRVRVGAVISPQEMTQFHKNRIWGQYLQARIFSLGTRFQLSPEDFNQKKEQPIAAPLPPDELKQAFEQLDTRYIVTSRGQFDVYVAPFQALGNIMFEIGRLRELTFRTAGEGTGRPRDMDAFDLYYLQLIIYDRGEGKIAGGYRLGPGDVIFKRFGSPGFYVSNLFKLKQGFHPILQRAVELGRSYVVRDYQKHRLPLFLMWKGILCFLLENPHYRYLYGPVSISKDYTEASRSVIVEFVKKYFFDQEMSRLVEPRKPYRAKVPDVNTRLLAASMHGAFDALEDFVENIEPAHFKVPVLFRQYLKQNARFVAFNVDPNFADCLDGLMILDIHHLPESTIEALQQEK
jgi:hypothetical protein